MGNRNPKKGQLGKRLRGNLVNKKPTVRHGFVMNKLRFSKERTTKETEPELLISILN